MPQRDVHAALELPPEQVGAALLAFHEDQWYERKGPDVAPLKLANAQVAFANADGGTIVSTTGSRCRVRVGSQVSWAGSAPTR